jgi:hypothetical protein
MGFPGICCCFRPCFFSHFATESVELCLCPWNFIQKFENFRLKGDAGVETFCKALFEKDVVRVDGKIEK